MGRMVLLPQRSVESAMLPFRHRILVRRLMLGFEGVVGRVMLLVEILVHTCMWVVIILVVIMGEHRGRKCQEPGHRDRQQGRLQQVRSHKCFLSAYLENLSSEHHAGLAIGVEFSVGGMVLSPCADARHTTSSM